MKVRSRGRRQTSSSRAADVAGRLIDQIMTGVLLPGDRLSELELARVHRVSQATVRDALFRVEAHGLVQRRPNIQTTVTNLTAAETQERLAVRAPLEALAVRLAAPRLSDGDRRHLGALIRRLRTTGDFAADYEFHSIIWARSGNATLASMLDRLITPLLPLVHCARRCGAQSRVRRAAAHAAILAAMTRRDHKRADRLIRSHITDAYSFLGRSVGDSRLLFASLGQRVK